MPLIAAIPRPVESPAALAADLQEVRRRMGRMMTTVPTGVRSDLARRITSAVVIQYWAESGWAGVELRRPPGDQERFSHEAATVFARRLAGCDSARAFFEIGELYCELLPCEFRTRHGVYYTPPELVERLLDLAERHGVNWSTARVLDPACGGAAFTAYLAKRMLAASAFLPTAARLRDLEDRLVALELDPFAAWLSAVFLDYVCLEVLGEVNLRDVAIVRTADTLQQSEQELGAFDLVVGNPPYGKLTLDPEQRKRFSRSLFGHANIYGVFTDLAVRLTRPGGVIAFVTPTSFLGGEYFKRLRQVLLAEAAPVHASFLASREGVFSGVLQETMLAVFRRTISGSAKSAVPGRVEVERLAARPGRDVEVLEIGTVSVGADQAGPWLLPRDVNECALIDRLGSFRFRLKDLGYRVATGPLVWNRHKSQFRDRDGTGAFPVLWAECIRSDGRFEFRASRRGHQPFVTVEPGQDFLLIRKPCVLVQRTTAKEQSRRLVAAAIPDEYVASHPGFVVENHVNMLLPIVDRPVVSQALLARLLNSEIVDRAFRCISGSVAVSAFELEALPWPDPERLVRRLRERGVNARSRHFDAVVAELFLDDRSL